MESEDSAREGFQRAIAKPFGRRPQAAKSSQLRNKNPMRLL